MSLFSRHKKAYKDNDATRCLGKALKEVNELEIKAFALEIKAYKDSFEQYTKLLNEIAEAIKESINNKHAKLIYTPILEEVYNLATALINERKYNNNKWLDYTQRKKDTELYNDLFALHEVLVNPSPENMKFLSDRAEASWLRVDTENTVAKLLLGIGIALFVIAFPLSFYLAVCTTTFVTLGLVIEIVGPFTGFAMVMAAPVFYTPKKESSLLQIEYDLHDFSKLYTKHAPSPEPNPEESDSMVLTAR